MPSESLPSAPRRCHSAQVVIDKDKKDAAVVKEKVLVQEASATEISERAGAIAADGAGTEEVVACDASPSSSSSRVAAGVVALEDIEAVTSAAEVARMLESAAAGGAAG